MSLKVNCCCRAKDSGVCPTSKESAKSSDNQIKHSQHQNQLHISKTRITPDPDPNPPLHFNPPCQHHPRAPPPPPTHHLKTLSHSLFHQSSQQTLAPPPHHSRACLPACPPHELSQPSTHKFKILLLLPPPLIPPIEFSSRTRNRLASRPKAYFATDTKKVANGYGLLWVELEEVKLSVVMIVEKRTIR